MNQPALLDADMATLARWARAGFDWWIDELRALVPATVRRWLSPPPALTAHWDGTALQLRRRGTPIARPTGSPSVALALPASAVLLRTVRLPRLGQADLGRLVALDAERLLPFAPGSALIDFDAVPEGDGLAVTIAALPLATAGAVSAAALADGLEVRRMGVADAADLKNGGVRFDFLPGWSEGGRGAHVPQRWWWGLVAVAFVLNLAVLIGRDVYNLRETEALVEAHGQTAATARTIRARVLGEDARRRDLLRRRAAGNPLPILAAATRTLPDSVWVQRFAWDSGQLRLAGYRTGAVDVVAALRRAPEFVAVRSTAVDVPAATGGAEPFEVSADSRYYTAPP